MGSGRKSLFYRGSVDCTLRNRFFAKQLSYGDRILYIFHIFLTSSLPCSSALSSCYSRVYQSLANLIRWSDQVMLEGVNSEDKEMVTTVKGVIKAVLDGVKVWQVPGGPGQGLRAASLLGIHHTRTCS